MTFLQIWDPYTGVGLCQLESPRYPPAVALHAIPAPSSLVLTGTTEATLRFLDLRTQKYAYEFKCSTSSHGKWEAIFVLLMSLNKKDCDSYVLSIILVLSGTWRSNPLFVTYYMQKIDDNECIYFSAILN